MPLTDWPFERGRTYNRRADIHGRYGGQQQGGIITPSLHQLVIAITGEEGEQHGYSDRLRADGVFEYFGEGQIGDMQMVRGNRQIGGHAAAGKSLLLFRKDRSGRLRFEGEWVCENVLERDAPDRNRAMRRAFVFELRPLEAVKVEVDKDKRLQVEEHIDVLRSQAMAAAKMAAPSDTVFRTVYERSIAVRRYVLARAKGLCEGCAACAPFNRPDGTPYLEPHHIRRVSDGGPDDPRHVIALCPNCHRRVHAADDGEAYNYELASKLRSIEG
ncbi:HNH endonuclease [Ancylobacter sp.]|uniref:HNH endonuclease n=1 Tax=Ancylobacter sp. TaxID=1872567 RepID=UPI003D1133C7